MRILRGFLPFVAFIVATKFMTAQAAVWLAFATAVAVFAYSRFREPAKQPKILEAGSVVLFGIVGLVARLAPVPLSLGIVRLAVDGGLLLVVLASLVLKNPFTLQYAREETPQELWSNPLFIALNVRITWAWALAFAINAGADALLAFVPAVPIWVDVTLAVGSLAGAALFTTQEAKRARARAPA
jgi:intracellular septation protein A